MLHEGHINLLEKAAKYGKVIVLLNSDKGTRLLKGYLAEPFEQRKKNLLATGLVEDVYVFGTNPTTMLMIIQPDVVVAGSDHTEEEILRKGGVYANRIVILPYTEGICSTDLYKERLRDAKDSVTVPKVQPCSDDEDHR